MISVKHKVRKNRKPLKNPELSVGSCYVRAEAAKGDFYTATVFFYTAYGMVTLSTGQVSILAPRDSWLEVRAECVVSELGDDDE